jgi:hypothetical protein
MKTNRLILDLFTLAAAAGLVAGCASTGSDKAASTASSLNKASTTIAKGNTQIDQVLADLIDLVNNPKPDMRDQYKEFCSSVDKLGATSKDVSEQAAEMKTWGAAYFAQWDKDSASLQNEGLRNRSEARKQEVADGHSQVIQTYETYR